MKRIQQALAIAVAILSVVLVSAGKAAAQAGNAPVPQKHDSNTLHKIGNAIQYPIRKAAENVSQAGHQTTNSKSVHHDRNTGNNYVIKPNGHKVYKSTVNPLNRRHRRHHHRHHYLPAGK